MVAIEMFGGEICFGGFGGVMPFFGVVGENARVAARGAAVSRAAGRGDGECGDLRN